MSNPEFIAQKCDGCGGWLHYDRSTNTYATHYPSQGDMPSYFHNHSEANRHARRAGWYIAERDLCPECREKMEVPG